MLGCVLSILTFLSPAAAVEVYRVDVIDFQGNRVHTANELRLSVQLSEGVTLSKETLKTAAGDDVHRLYATGFFSDIRADIQFREDRTAFVTFLVVEQPQISDVVFSGLKKLDEKSLRDVLPTSFSAGNFLNEYLLKRAESAILNRYYEDGYYFAKVTVVKEPVEADRVRVRFDVEEGDKLKVGRFEVEFDRRMPPFEGWRRKMQIKWHFSTGKGAIYSRELLNNDVKRFVDVLKEKGYLLAAIEPRTEIDSKRRRMNVRLIVHVGPRMRVGHISFEGNKVLPESDLRPKLAFASGEFFTLKKFSQSMESIRKAYEKIGYLEAEVLNRPTILEEAGRVDFTIDIREGQLIYVEQILVEGLTKTRSKIARREIVQKEGERYDGELVDLSKRNLNNTGYFENVIVLTEKGSKPNARVLIFRLAEGRTGTLQIGMGFSSLSGFVGFSSISKRNFDLFDHPFKKDNKSPYFTGAGQNISTSVEVGSKRTNFDVSWTNPWINDRLKSERPSPRFPTSLTTRVFRSGQDYDQYHENRNGVNFQLGRRFGNFLSGFMGYRWEGVRLSDIQTGAPASILLLGNRDDAVSAFSFGSTYDHTDNVFWPTRGVRIAFEDEIAGIGGNVEFNRPSLDLRAFRSGGWKNVVAFRMNFVTVSNPFSSDVPPDYEQFYLGGPNSVRGYDDREINVRSVAGQKEGGRTATYYNLEYRIPVLENTFSILLFHDAGMVSESPYALNGDVKTSAGLGLRVQSPMGPIRLDFGYRFSDTYRGANDKGQFEPHFSFGQQF
ncbi:MAG: outer membrane protein assembly factor BamA [Candidatus Lindowbacteria bacterium RIFCSPLOWO2_12_FULL_62_27]|nr:MAG: outer membrane protein assembly factor BamA [Candidatus Lindowbacteria bacterium RIFCSPLOWO2_02_FULL_62_12]OGH59203.1 MAG: outer membrane protein assembly factor BamA [Candidatus Lindowbacteria bacterium RIFCSPLOWO2_12_FULL_62_27]